MATNSIDMRNARTAQYLAIKRSSAGYKQDTVAIELMAARLAVKQVKSLESRLDVLQAAFDKVCLASDPIAEEPEAKEPTVELDPQEVQAFRTMCERYYSGDNASYDMSDASPEDFDEVGQYLYRTVN